MYAARAQFVRSSLRSCHCATLVDAQGLHAMVCKKAPGKLARYRVLNDIIWRAFSAAGIPAVKMENDDDDDTWLRISIPP